MKIKILTLISILTIVSLIFNSCRKGEDDPWISLRSRNNRVIGKWKLEEYSYKKEYTSFNTYLNNINDDKTTITKDTTITNTYISEVLTENTIFNYSSISRYKDYDSGSNSFLSKEKVDCNNANYLNKYKYIIELEIKKDYTWVANYTKYQISSSTKFNSYYIINNDTLYSNTTDTIIDTNLGSNNWSEQGYWYWEDSKKNKIVINAGPMKGYLKRLSNKEIIIEEEYSDNYNTINYYDGPFYTYEDTDNPYNEENGIRTSNITENINTKIYYKWVAN